MIVTVTSPMVSTTTSLTASATSIIVGSVVRLDATVVEVGSDSIAVGAVTFYSNGVPIGSSTLDANGKAQLSVLTLPVGDHLITADYSGSTLAYKSLLASASHSTSVTVIYPIVSTTTLLTASTTSSTTGGQVTFTASVAKNNPGANLTGTVTFTSNGVAIGSAILYADGNANLTLSNLEVGINSIVAYYSGNESGSASSVLTVTVDAGVSSAPTPIPPVPVDPGPPSPVAPPVPTAPPVPVGPAHQTADFSLSTPASVSITAGSSAIEKFTISPSNGFNQAVTVTCAGLPAGISCADLTVKPDGINPAWALLNVLSTSSLSKGPMVVLSGMPLGLIVLMLLLCSKKKSVLIGIVAVGLSVMAGCGASNGIPVATTSQPTSTPNPVPSTTTSIVTITATSGTLSHITTFALAVTK